MVAEKLVRIPKPADRESLNIVPLIENAWLGVFGTGLPVLFFECSIEEPGTSRTLARGIETVASDRFEIVRPDRSGRPNARAGVAISLREPGLIEVFAAVAAHAASLLCVDASAFLLREKIERYLAEWIEFFAPQSLSAEEVIGLWGELHVLKSLPDVERGVACWTGPFGKLFDFMGNGVSMEVKTSLRSAVATFSLGQLNGRDDGHSVFVRVLEDHRNGSTVDQLVKQIRSSLSNSVQLDAALVRARFKPGANGVLRLSAEDLRAIPNPRIPRPLVQDPRVQAVRFTVDVDGLKEGLTPVAPLFKRLIGQRKLRG